MAELTLTIDGAAFGGWISVSVRRAMDEMAATFRLDLTDRWTPDQAPVPLLPHRRVTIAIDGVPVIVGVIDQASLSYDDGDHSVSVSGRSLTGQLVDNDAALGEFADATLPAIAARLAAPYGVGVRTLADTGAAFGRVRVEPGETVAEILDRLARQRGVWLTDDAAGGLVIRQRSDAVQGAIVGPSATDRRRVNVLRGEAALNGTAQHSQYRVLGQTGGADRWDGAIPAGANGTARDASVPLYRPRTILSETQGASGSLRDRAVFEAALRRGRSRLLTYTMGDWHRPDGRLWESGLAATVEDDTFGLSGQPLLVVATEFLRSDEEGETATLTLGEPEAYDLLAIPETKPASTLWPGATP